MKNTVIIRPIITEKSIRDTQQGIFSFVVVKNATKETIKNEVEKMFGVNVVSIATSILKGDSISTGVRRTKVNKQPRKKAFVKLKEGQKISAFEL